MNKLYFIIGLITLILFFLFIYVIIETKNESKKEPFVPKIKQIYNPMVRNFTLLYDKFLNPFYNIQHALLVKLKKMNLC
jgi:hypothetical protein